MVGKDSRLSDCYHMTPFELRELNNKTYPTDSNKKRLPHSGDFWVCGNLFFNVKIINIDEEISSPNLSLPPLRPFLVKKLFHELDDNLYFNFKN